MAMMMNRHICVTAYKEAWNCKEKTLFDMPYNFLCTKYTLEFIQIICLYVAEIFFKAKG